METEQKTPSGRAANDNPDPYETPQSTLGHLYYWKQKVLELDTSKMTVAQYRRYKDSLALFDEAERMALDEL